MIRKLLQSSVSCKHHDNKLLTSSNELRMTAATLLPSQSSILQT